MRGPAASRLPSRPNHRSTLGAAPTGCFGTVRSSAYATTRPSCGAAGVASLDEHALGSIANRSEYVGAVLANFDLRPRAQHDKTHSRLAVGFRYHDATEQPKHLWRQLAVDRFCECTRNDVGRTPSPTCHPPNARRCSSDTG